MSNSSSPLSSTFNSKPKLLNFKFALSENVGLFCLPELHQPEGMHLLKENGINTVESLIEECCDPKRRRKIVEYSMICLTHCAK